MSGSIVVPSGGLTIDNQADANDTLTIKNTSNYFKYNNNSIDCYDSLDAGASFNINTNADQYVKCHSMFIDLCNTNTMTGGYYIRCIQ